MINLNEIKNAEKFELACFSFSWNSDVVGYIVKNKDGKVANLQYAGGGAYGNHWGFGLDGGYIEEGFSAAEKEAAENAFYDLRQENESFLGRMWGLYERDNA